MKITSHNNVNFKAITPSSKADIMKEIKALRKAGEFREAAAATTALKKLSNRATDYTIVYCGEVLVLNSKNPNYRSKEIMAGLFKNMRLSEVLGKASQYIAKEKLRTVKIKKHRDFWRSCWTKIAKVFTSIK